MVYRIVTLTSATGNNLGVAYRTAQSIGDAAVVLNISDRSDCGSLSVAEELGVPSWSIPYEDWLASTGMANDRLAQDLFHDQIAIQLKEFERQSGRIDLIVLAYHRHIRGRFLAEYRGRIVNQHPGDLAVRSAENASARALIGMHAVQKAYELGRDHTRTTTILVDETLDGGPIIARGPKVFFRTDRPLTAADLVDHEVRQKTESDAPVLRWVISELARGNLTINHVEGQHHLTHHGGAVSDLGVAVESGSDTTLADVR